MTVWQFFEKLMVKKIPVVTPPKPTPIPQPENDIQRVPDHVDQLVQAINMLAMRQYHKCNCTDCTKISIAERSTVEFWLNMIIDARIKTILRKQNEETRDISRVSSKS